MAAPNILALTTVSAKTDVLAVTGSAVAVVSNGAASGKVIKVNSLYICSIHDTVASWVTVDLYRGTTATRIVYKLPIPLFSTLNAIERTGPIYLQEGDSIRLTAQATTSLEATCSYEEMS